MSQTINNFKKDRKKEQSTGVRTGLKSKVGEKHRKTGFLTCKEEGRGNREGSGDRGEGRGERKKKRERHLL